MKRNPIARLCAVCLEIADYYSTPDEEGHLKGTDESDPLLSDLGLGPLALASYLRAGVSEVSALSDRAANWRSDMNIYKNSEHELQEWVDDIFGTEEPQTLNDELEGKLQAFMKETGVKEYLAGILGDWDEAKEKEWLEKRRKASKS